ncbi:MAG: discoidin domain-containing protein [Verrucomicrobia bacterium]|nr:discoidin domain-containing protein [Verrucomicrobiota bacterium]
MRSLSWLGVVGMLLALGAGRAETLPLAGEWRFRLDADQQGEPARWFAAELGGDQRLRLPGTMDDAGLGPRNAKEPTLEGPYRVFDYAGAAWYQREVEIPADWQGRRVTLFLERCRWVTTVWLDDRRLGSGDSLVAPHVYDLGTAVAPGRHRLTVRVDNTVKHNLGRFVSALFGGTWGNMNGIVGRIELAATPPVWIDDVQVYPDRAQRNARVAVRIGNATGRAGRGELHVGPQRLAVTWGLDGGAAEAVLDLATTPDWDEFAPRLTEVRVRLGGHERTVRFGLRSLGTSGTQFTLNGRPLFLRGTLECSVWPLTGYPPTDVESWRKICRTIRAYGLNHLRFHSWCPPEAAFAAADEEGILLQVEGPQANVPAGADPARDAFMEAEYQRIVDTYGNHPSFALMALGNEFGGNDALLARWVGDLRARDSRHLYTAASNNRQRPANRQFTVLPQGRGIPAAGTQRDLREVVAADGRPAIGHEIGQWMYYPDFREIAKYTGVLAPRNLELVREDLARKHQLELAPRYVAASGQFATRLYKEEIEVLLRTPGYGGFQLLDLHDYPTQGTALVGPLDAFWESKGFISPEAWRRFCGPTVPLLRFARRTYTTAETIEAVAELAHFGPADLARVEPRWILREAGGREVASGKLPVTSAPTGRLTGLGSVQVALAKVAAPARVNLSVAIAGTEFANDWDLWVYPATSAPVPPTDLARCRTWEEAKAALAAGRKVLFFAHGAATQQSRRGRFLPVFWSPVWFPQQKPNTMGLLCDPAHPLLAHFPTDFHSDWQWYELMQRSRMFNLDAAPPAYRPLVQVIDNFARNERLGLIFEGRVGPGRLLVCGIDLPALEGDPAARQLLASLYAYLESAAFRPAAELDAALLEGLFVPNFANELHRLGAQVRVDTQADDFPAEQLLDGRPETFWHTSWAEGAAGYPHHIIVELPRPTRVTGLRCLPRQDGNRNGWIKDYVVQVSTDGRVWEETVAKGSLARDDSWKEIRFARAVETRWLKLVVLGGFDPARTHASLAELTLLPEPARP